MDVLFLSPSYPPEMNQFSLALAAAGARVHGVGDTPAHELPIAVREALASYLQVPAMGDVEEVKRRILAWLGGRSPDRVEALWEPLTVLAAELREAFGIPGMSPSTVVGFRDKAVMRARVAAGESLDALLPEAFAVAREASRRVLGLRPAPEFEAWLQRMQIFHEHPDGLRLGAQLPDVFADAVRRMA